MDARIDGGPGRAVPSHPCKQPTSVSCTQRVNAAPGEPRTPRRPVRLSRLSRHDRASDSAQPALPPRLPLCSPRRNATGVEGVPQLYDLETIPETLQVLSLAGGWRNAAARRHEVAGPLRPPLQIQRRFTAAARAAGIEARVTAHSGRVGLASELTARGASTTEVMLAGNWKTARMVAHYSAGATAERGAVRKYL